MVMKGSMKGEIDLGDYHVSVGSTGQVEADISAAHVTISGRLIGNIKARGRVELTREADFTGEIKAKRIAVEEGAYLNAVIALERGARETVSLSGRQGSQAADGSTKGAFSPSGGDGDKK